MAARLAERGVRDAGLRRARRASAIRCTAPAFWRRTASTNFDLPDDATLNQLTVGPLRVAGRHSRRLHDADAARHRHRSPGRSIARWQSGRWPRAPKCASARASPRSRSMPTACARGRRRHDRSRRVSPSWPAARTTRSSGASASACRATYLQTAQRELPAPLSRRRRAAFRPRRRARRVRVGGAGRASRGRVRAHRRDGVARHPRLLRPHARSHSRSLGRDRAWTWRRA